MLPAGPVCSCAHFLVHIAHETAGAARTRSSLRPRLGESFGQASGAPCAGGSRNCIHRHCEPTGRREAPPDDRLREAIHCHLLYGKMDCFASLAMTKTSSRRLVRRSSRAKYPGAQMIEPKMNQNAGTPGWFAAFAPGMSPYRSLPCPIWLTPHGCAIFYLTG
jgi:hypothetical protein